MLEKIIIIIIKHNFLYIWRITENLNEFTFEIYSAHNSCEHSYDARFISHLAQYLPIHEHDNDAIQTSLLRPIKRKKKTYFISCARYSYSYIRINIVTKRIQYDQVILDVYLTISNRPHLKNDCSCTYILHVPLIKTCTTNTISQFSLVSQF